MKKHFQIAKEEFSLYGNEGTQLQNLLALLIGQSAEPAITGQLAALGINGITQLSKEELMEYPGIGEMSATRINAALALASLAIKRANDTRYIIRSPEDAAKYLDELKHLQQEHFVAVYLNTKNQVISKKTIFIGSLNSCIVHPREIFKEAYRLSSASVIVAHNHPSGNRNPSREDIEMTKRLAETGRVLGIELIDHIIIGDGSFTSLKESGYIN
ncbi:RadC family protein [Cytobacillus oceanisediminis]|uniref:RadC family protein n=1 Tax=Cytobacillus oceanisediminis TaxID=665099 RepID=UPI001FB1B6B9|nr:DNA repair protein RadC [Cytobacillus oceanisediminis]UOE58135.1 DNA repair protein RadC [Cytobacillus oceanisediminis]